MKESYRKLQRINQGLEDKLLRVVDHYEGEKGGLSKDLKHLTNQLLDAQALVNKLTQENVIIITPYQ